MVLVAGNGGTGKPSYSDVPAGSYDYGRGCLTAKQCENLKEIVGEDGNFDMIDGYEDMEDEVKAKIRQGNAVE